ncbi:TPA: winged helix-turn-helix transcriptional regulator [Candidatus Avacholeplasma faecigallinarum]|nr:winged helix-turn-helix transcriptional regulator [Candidatus Avacholeplasma faecigallinarum]
MQDFHEHSLNFETLIKKIPSYQKASEIADILSVLSDATRLRILWLLCHTTECVSDIALAIGMSAPAVSHHLKLLKQHKIIQAKKVGKEMLYTLAQNRYAELIHNMIDSMLQISCPNKEDN